ncbi:hypothetical protein M0802_004249, partial [Mischocyttarus mexicanus]
RVTPFTGSHSSVVHDRRYYAIFVDTFVYDRRASKLALLSFSVKISAIRMWREPPGGGCKAPTYIFAMILLALLALTHVTTAEDESMGPVFVKEPPNRVDFSNGTGAEVECRARGNPQPDIIWVRGDGTAVGDVPGLRQVLPNGNLVFPPFRAEDYRQEVHAQVYSCLARSPAGSVHSRDVNVRAVVHQYYQSEVNNEYVIRGNAAILKCSIPSFVAEFVQVVGWQDDQGNSFNPEEGNVVTQYYEAEVVSEYVIRGNAAILKCTIPSFVAEFVSVESWVGSDGSTFRPSNDYGTHSQQRIVFIQTYTHIHVYTSFIYLYIKSRAYPRFFSFWSFIPCRKISFPSESSTVFWHRRVPS